MIKKDGKALYIQVASVETPWGFSVGFFVQDLLKTRRNHFIEWNDSNLSWWAVSEIACFYRQIAFTSYLDALISEVIYREAVDSGSYGYCLVSDVVFEKIQTVVQFYLGSIFELLFSEGIMPDLDATEEKWRVLDFDLKLAARFKRAHKGAIFQ